MSLQFPAGHMELPMTGRCSFDSTCIATKLDAGRWGKCQLSFALLFSSIRAYSTKELSQIFAQIPGGGHASIFNAPSLLQHCSDWVQLHTGSGKSALQLLFEILFSFIGASSKKNYLKFSLQFLAGDMQLLGRSDLCQWCKCRDPHQHFREQPRWNCK
jgi:hypothetical protein